MPDSITLTSTLFLTLVTTEPNGAGAIVRILARKNAQSFDKLARGQRLSMAQSRVAGVTNSALEDASDLDVVLQDLLEFAEGCDLWIAALGAPVRERLKEAAVSGGYPGILGPGVLGLDELSAAVLPTVGRRGLQDLCAHYGLASDAAAGGTAESFVAEPQLMEQLCARLLDDLEKLPLPLLSELNWMLSKTDHPLRKILKTAESHGVETQFVETFNSGKISFEKLFKDFSKLIDKLRPEDDERDVNVEHAPAAELLETGAVRRMMGADGPLSKLDGYEERPEQERMAERVARAFNEGKHLMIEAGTGVGKSLAYLLPSILYAKRSGRPVMLSTYTKNLQSQLYHTDIPFLKKHLGIEFDAALLRGRTNYLCLRKFMFTLHESAHELDDDERGKMLPVMTWAASTEHGDVSELAAFSPEQSPALWDRLHTVGEDCLKRACPFYKRCFVYKARALAKTADVVVLNHALVFSSLNAEAGALPKYDEIVFDEAHKLEDAATEHLACEIKPSRAYKIANRLFRTQQSGGAGKGLLPTLLMYVDQTRNEFGAALHTKIREQVLAAMQAVAPANEGTEAFFDVVREWTEKPETDDDNIPDAPFVPQERGRTGFGAKPFKAPYRAAGGGKFPKAFDDRKRYATALLKPDAVAHFKLGKESAISGLGKLRQSLERLEEFFPDIKKRNVPRSRELMTELSAQNLFLQELIHDIEFIVKGDEPNYVYWSERWGRRSAQMIAAPLDIAALLHGQLYEKKRSIIFASATLSVRDADAGNASGLAPADVADLRWSGGGGEQAVDFESLSNAAPAHSIKEGAIQERPVHDDDKPHPKSFEFLKLRFGLSYCQPKKLDELLLGSPFDYEKQCRLYVPTFLPEPGGGREKDFSAQFSAMCAQLVLAAGGRTMILYTSYSALNASAAILQKILAPEGIEVMAQGRDGSREALLASLKAGGRRVLLGTASFWEGVDVRGGALSLLIIAKLPFAVFTDPVVQGRCELLEAAGKDAFLHFSVPNAILKLRQGFGRLIRSKQDRGVVILADKRVVTKRYGAAFLRALPARACAVSFEEGLVKEVDAFLNKTEIA